MLKFIDGMSPPVRLKSMLGLLDKAIDEKDKKEAEGLFTEINKITAELEGIGASVVL